LNDGFQREIEMIATLDGTLEYLDVNTAIVKVAGIGFKVNVSQYTLGQFGEIGSSVSIFIHLHLRTDNISLFGFSTKEEMILFKDLISVSGIGPKVALALLSSMNPKQLILAITSGSVEVIVQVPGIGKKVASRLIVELKGKLEKEWGEESLPLDPENAEAVAALTGLGYSLREATQVLTTIQNSSSISLEEKVRLALQKLGSD